MAYAVAFLVAASVLVLVYLVRLATVLGQTPEEALKLSPDRWTEQEILAAYKQAATQPIDVRPYLPSATQRRYIITGSSGLVGGWIVRHLILRGEDPRRIRLLDCRPPHEAYAGAECASFYRVDIRNASTLCEAFTAPWPQDVEAAPLTVIHTAAVIDCSNRADDLLGPISEINVSGTSNVIEAAKLAGASVFIATSSASISASPPQWFPPPWQVQPDDFFRHVENAEPRREAGKCSTQAYYGIYARTKHVAETLVQAANNEKSGFRTGLIRPGNALYGTGVEDVSSITWRMLSTGGHGSWAHNCVQNFVSAQNVSIAHLLLEAKLISDDGVRIGGQAYAITDPGPPVTHGDLYKMLSMLSNTETRFPSVPGLPLLCLAYLVEAYVVLRRRYAMFLPQITGQLLLCQPAVFNISMVNICYKITKAEAELGYRGPYTTLHGVAADVLAWNHKHPQEQLDYVSLQAA